MHQLQGFRPAGKGFQERVIKENTFHRTSENYKRLYKGFNNLFFFADAGNGDLFGFEMQGGVLEKSDVYFWNHEDDTREWLAQGLKAFIEGWLTGSILI